MEAVKRKNVALRTLIEAVDIPQPDSFTEKGHENHRSVVDNLDIRMHGPIDSHEKVIDSPLGMNVEKECKIKQQDDRKLQKNSGIRLNTKGKKLRRFRFPSAEPKPKASRFQTMQNHSQTRSSGLVPDLLQPDVMALKI